MNHSQTRRRLKPAGLLLTITAFLGLAAQSARCQGAFNDPGDPQHRISALTAPNTVARYGEFEATMQIATQAANLQLPYDPVEPPYAAHLFPDEDAAQGVSVDALLLPPGQADWAHAQDQPAFYFQGYDDNGVPTGEQDWHLRFAPDTVGTWQFRIKVSDAQGVALGAPQSFSVTPSSSHGFVRVSPTDSRYFEYSDGTPFLPAGDNDTGGDPADLQRFIRDGAVGLHRVWISGNGGMEVVGGGGNIQSFHGVSFNPANAEPAAGLGHGQRFALSLPGTGAGIECDWSPQAGRPYTVSAWVRLAGAPGAQPGAVWAWTPITQRDAADVPVPDDGQWHRVTYRVPPAAGYGPHFVVQMDDTAAGGGAQYPFLMDDLAVTDDGTGEPAFGGVGMDWVTRYSQRASARLDRLVAVAMDPAVPQFLKLTCFQHEDAELRQIEPDGTDAPAPDQSLSVGGSGDPRAGTCVQRFQGYFARYLMARWGWSPAVMGVEHVNEGDPDGAAYFAGAQAFAARVHALTADHRVLATTSGWSGYNWNFYQDAILDSTGQPAYPDIDFADVHDYVFSTSSPYNTLGHYYPGYYGGSVSPAGGPGGAGVLTMTASGDTPLPVTRLRGAGTWTIKFLYRTDPDATFNSPAGNWYTHGGGQVVTSAVPNPFSATPAAPVPDWTEYTQTFTTTQPQQGMQAQAVRGLLRSGREYFADVRLYDPQGALWMRLTFDEPDMLRDHASYARYLPLELESYSGVPAIGKPLVVGETEPVGDDSAGESATTRARLDPSFDAGGDAVRQMAWGGIGSAPAVFQWWYEFGGEAGAGDFWRYYAAVQRFMAGVPVSDGRYRDLGAAVSTPGLAAPGLAAIGQKDAQAGRAYLYVYNRAATWEALAERAPVAPVTGTVAITGLSDGPYTVQRWDPGTGTIVSTEVDTASGGTLTIPVNGLAQDTAMKIAPASTPPVASAAPAPPAPSGDLAIHSGGGAVGDFAADQSYYGGTSVTTTDAISTDGVSGAGPTALYQTGRVGALGYVLRGLPPNKAYTMHLHFAETQCTGPGQRVFGVTANGAWDLENFDVFQAAGGKDRAVVETFPIRTTPAGVIILRLLPTHGSTEINGIELQP